MIKEFNQAYAKIMTIDDRFAELERRMAEYRAEFRRELDIVTARIHSIDKEAIEEKAELRATVAVLGQRIASMQLTSRTRSTVTTLNPPQIDGPGND